MEKKGWRVKLRKNGNNRKMNTRNRQQVEQKENHKDKERE